MKISNLSLMLLALAIPHFAAAANPVPLIQDEHDKLVCGDAEVRVTSSCLHFDEQETQCKKQTLQLTNSANNITKKLPHDGKPIRQSFVENGPVLDAFVTGWACVKSASGTSYIYLSYTCVENDKQPECAGTKREWGRVFGADGKNFTTGIARRGKELERVYRRLGLSESLEQGIQLQDLKY